MSHLFVPDQRDPWLKLAFQKEKLLWVFQKKNIFAISADLKISASQNIVSASRGQKEVVPFNEIEWSLQDGISAMIENETDITETSTVDAETATAPVDEVNTSLIASAKEIQSQYGKAFNIRKKMRSMTVMTCESNISARGSRTADQSAEETENEDISTSQISASENSRYSCEKSNPSSNVLPGFYQGNKR